MAGPIRLLTKTDLCVRLPNQMAKALLYPTLRLTSYLAVLLLQSLRSHASAVRFGNDASCVFQYLNYTKLGRGVSIGFGNFFIS